jgi:hypothetical protein
VAHAQSRAPGEELALTGSSFRNQPLLTADELPARLDEFYRALEQFNAGYYFESHETLEDLWMVAPLPERQMFQGIIQMAAAFVHLTRGEYPGILKLLDAAADKLAALAPARLGVDVSALLADIGRARAEIADAGEERLRDWDERRRPIVRFEAGGTAPRCPSR